MITSAVNVASTLPGLYAIDKIGRRPLLLWGAVGMAVSQLLVAVLGTTTTSQDAAGNIIVHNVAAQKAGIAFICIFIFFFAATWGPIAWVVTGEIFPLKVRAKCLSMTTATNCMHSFLSRFPAPNRLTSHRALQLGHRLFNPLPREMGSRKRKSPVQNLLHLVRLLLPLYRLRLLLHL